MREVTDKSVKLNRDLEKMLVEALERDQLDGVETVMKNQKMEK